MPDCYSWAKTRSPRHERPPPLPDSPPRRQSYSSDDNNGPLLDQNHRSRHSSNNIPQRGRYPQPSRGSYRNNENYDTSRGAGVNYDDYDNYNQPKFQRIGSRRDSGRGRHGFWIRSFYLIL